MEQMRNGAEEEWVEPVPGPKQSDLADSSCYSTIFYQSHISNISDV